MDTNKLLEMARKLNGFGETKRALTAYTLAVQEGLEDPADEMEAAVYILENEGDYKIAYTSFVSLFNRGVFRDAILAIMTEAFYLPNVREIKARYVNNCKRMKKYPYIFRKDLPEFEELKIQFFPFDGDSYIPYYPDERRFGEYVNFNNPVVTRNYFKDLEKPVLVADVYSQYELEYLCDNLRKSEYIGRDNHLYLHYTDWEVFCAHMQCISFSNILLDNKPVFLFGDEVSRYPIDFAEEFGIDYSRYPVKPIGIREVNKLIWHTQLSSHNGGDFFNEIFDGHPNLIAIPSIMYYNAQNIVKQMKEDIRKNRIPGNSTPRTATRRRRKGW